MTMSVVERSFEAPAVATRNKLLNPFSRRKRTTDAEGIRSGEVRCYIDYFVWI